MKVARAFPALLRHGVTLRRPREHCIIDVVSTDGPRLRPIRAERLEEGHVLQLLPIETGTRRT